MTTWLKCGECNEMFEVSNEIADAMHRWRDESGEPFACGECAGDAEIILIEVPETEPKGVRSCPKKPHNSK